MEFPVSSNSDSIPDGGFPMSYNYGLQVTRVVQQVMWLSGE